MDYYISNVQLSNPIVLSASYYDDYSHVLTNMLDPLDYCPQYGLQRKDDAHGLLTGTAERILGEDITNEFRWETYYYDGKGNILQTQTTREDGGVNITTTEWSFTGKPVRMNIIHHYGESQESTEYYEYSYDNWNRPLTIKHRLGENAECTTLSDISYDALGRVSTTKCNGNPDLTTTHTYNVRSWKKSIAGPGMSENLTYEDYGRWNGNITSASYDYDGTTLHHDYTYDGLSRLVGATTVTENGSSSDLYNYDAHSNVIAYERSGMDAISKSMSYNGNRMTSVTSSLPGASGAISYDSIGRVISSDIEGMTEVKYNVVGYPSFVGQADGGYVHHTYTAGGARMASRRTDAAGVVTLMEYEGNEVIENGKLRMLLFDGGYVDLSGNAPRYCWYTKDHLGSVRAVADADGNVFATYAYSAYGEDFAVNAPVSGSSVNTTNGSSAGQVANGGWTIGENIFLPTVTYSPNEESDWQPFKFGGKESLTRVGLDLYDFGARMYSPSNMRWMTMDPLCEKHFDISPYAYCFGNPIRYTDPDGRDPVVVPFVPIGYAIYEAGKWIFIGIAALTTYEAVDYAKKSHDYGAGKRWQDKQDQKEKDSYNKRRGDMQNSINKNFPNNTDPNQEPEWNGQNRPLETLLRSILVAKEVFVWTNWGRYLSKPEPPKEDNKAPNEENPDAPNGEDDNKTKDEYPPFPILNPNENPNNTSSTNASNSQLWPFANPYHSH